MELSAEDQAALDAVQAEFNSLTAQHESDEELPAEVDARFGELEAEIERLEAKRLAYDPADIARSGAFVILNHDGTVRIERGFVRAEDEQPEPEMHDVSSEGEGDDTVNENGGAGRNGAGDERLDGEDEGADDHKPLSEILIRDLTASRTLGLRLALREQPEVAIVAVTHALSAQIFYRGADAHVVDIRPSSTYLASHADGIEDTKAGKPWADCQAHWAAQMPRDVSGLWTFVVELDHDSRMALFAHCAALTVNAVKLPTERKPRAMATADRLAEAVALDMTAHWRPTARSYFGRITKPHMAEAAEQLVIATGWLPALMRTPEVARERPEPRQADAVTETNPDAYSVTAE